MDADKMFWVWFVVCGILGIAWYGFVVWVIIKILQYIGVI